MPRRFMTGSLAATARTRFTPIWPAFRSTISRCRRRTSSRRSSTARSRWLTIGANEAPAAGCPGSDRYETKRLLRGKGSPKLRVANQPTSGDPYAGFWPARSDYQEREGGVAPSRREDRRYRSGEKARRRGAVAAGGERRAQR